ncbi:MerR family transcriptional regulator [Streptomyces sp. ISL-98]|uniref:MerR family transcriptional regulator n=1 Tax=Streptomyces sp. ISL-98 TaxID=2819192 RepID=UPI001BE58C94|nr:MerR family transcriptional regulator [Streptomyces sp. ISL-98]MBT2505532.1 MerR family transcriptional regulator [Streptomyces sp. ISL-98]
MDKGAEAREYRTEELARAAGITVRTLRFYRERKLLPPPRREGRIAWYDSRHLARLRTIAALLERGHTLTGIADLATTFESGRDVGELLGLGEDSADVAATWTEETPVRLTPEDLADYFAGEVTPENFAAALELGYLATDGEEIVHISRRLLDVSAALVREGVPLAAVLKAGREVRKHTTAMAEIFTDMVRTHMSGDAPGDATNGATRDATGNATEAPAASLERLRPLAKSVVEAELSMALDRLMRAEKDA